MRGNPATHLFIRPSNLNGILTLLASEPGQWTPFAGGTELMVSHAAGQLRAQKLINIWGVPELSRIDMDDNFLSIGGGVTFRQIRDHATIASEFPLLAQAAGWIGSIANQSRATLAGNIVNGSPAADAPPSLLVYNSEIELISQRGVRRVPYASFHVGYKQNILRIDELVYALHLPRRFTTHNHYLRKVGARRAMAISKVALAATAVVKNDIFLEIRLAAASVADRPVRLLITEAALANQPLTHKTIANARMAIYNEVKPIDDIRSTAEYRRCVAANLLQQFIMQCIAREYSR